MNTKLNFSREQTTGGCGKVRKKKKDENCGKEKENEQDEEDEQGVRQNEARERSVVWERAGHKTGGCWRWRMKKGVTVECVGEENEVNI